MSIPRQTSATDRAQSLCGPAKEVSGEWVLTTTDAEIEAALEEARNVPDEPLIVEAAYRGEPGLEFLMLKLSDGRRLLIPREELSELKNATAEQATDLFIVPTATGVWWLQLDDGLYLPDFLEYRWGKARGEVAA